MTRKYQRVAFGFGFCPFWWMLGFDQNYGTWQRMLCVGPFRFSWRGWS